VFDDVSYKTTTNSFFVNLNVFPTEVVEVYGNFLYYTGTASSFDINLDSSNLIRQPAGMDYDLFNDVVAGYSDIDLNQVSLVFGANYRFVDSWLVNVMGGYNDFGDDAPYLFDMTGRRFYFQVGASLIF